VQTKTALPRFGHAQIVLPAQTTWEASPAWRNGTMTRVKPGLLSRKLAGRMPRTGRRRPSSPSSSNKVQVHTVRWSSLAELSRSMSAGLRHTFVCGQFVLVLN
jgi:hypothetical protein